MMQSSRGDSQVVEQHFQAPQNVSMTDAACVRPRPSFHINLQVGLSNYYIAVRKLYSPTWGLLPVITRHI